MKRLSHNSQVNKFRNDRFSLFTFNRKILDKIISPVSPTL